MRLLDLQTGNQCLIDDADLVLIEHLTIYEGVNGYVYFSEWVDGASRPRTLHGLLMNPPKGAHVDHINGNKLDNRRTNLRVVTPQRNQVNRKSLNRNNSSGIRGVAYRPNLSQRNPWHVQIGVNGNTKYVGMYPSREQAVEARRAAELEHFGELCP